MYKLYFHKILSRALHGLTTSNNNKRDWYIRGLKWVYQLACIIRSTSQLRGPILDNYRTQLFVCNIGV